jgi:hypothetical protein
MLRENVVGDRGLLQKELAGLALVRKHSLICLKRSRHIESAFKRGAFALVDAKRERGAG